MKRLISKKIVYIFLLSIIISTFSQAKVIVLVNRDNKQWVMSRSMLKKIFLGVKTRWKNNRKIIAVNLHPSRKARRKFESKILKVTPRKVQRYWVRQAIRGNIYPPKTVSFEKKMIKLLIRKSSAIGYISSINWNPKLKKYLRIVKVIE